MRTSTTIQADIVFDPNFKKQYQNLQEFYDSVYLETYPQLDSVHKDSSSGAHSHASPFNDYFLRVKNVSDLQKIKRKFKQNIHSDWLFLKVENYFQPSGDCGYVFFYKDENGNIMQRVLIESGLDSLYYCKTSVDYLIERQEGINKDYIIKFTINDILYRYLSQSNFSAIALFQFINSLESEVLEQSLEHGENLNLKKKLFLLFLAKFFKERFELFEDYFKSSREKLIERGIDQERGVSCKRIESRNIEQGSAKVIIQRHAIAGDNTPKVVYLKIKKCNSLGKLKPGRNCRDLSSSDDRLKNVYCFIKITFKDNGLAEIDGSNIYFCKANEPHVKTAKSIDTIHENYQKELVRDIYHSCSPIKIESYEQNRRLFSIATDLKITQHIKEYHFNAHNNSFTTCGDSIEDSISSDSPHLSSSDGSGQLQSGINCPSQRNSAVRANSDFIYNYPAQTRGGAGRVSDRASVSAPLVSKISGQKQSYNPLLQISADILVCDRAYLRHGTSPEVRRYYPRRILSERISSAVSSLEGGGVTQFNGQSLSASLVHRYPEQGQSRINYRKLQGTAGLFARDGSDRRNGALGEEEKVVRRLIYGGILKKTHSVEGRADMSLGNLRSLSASLVHISPREKYDRSESGDSLISPKDQQQISNVVHISSDDPAGGRLMQSGIQNFSADRFGGDSLTSPKDQQNISNVVHISSNDPAGRRYNLSLMNRDIQESSANRFSGI